MPINSLIAGSLTGAFLIAPVHQVSGSLSDRPDWMLGYSIVRPAAEIPQSKTTSVTSEDWKSVLSNNVHGLSSLAEGWDGPKSLPISAAVLSRAVFFIETALESIGTSSGVLVTPPRLVPGGDGSVQIEWHNKRGELELDIDADGAAHIWINDRLNGVEFDGEGEKALALFYRWAPWIASQRSHVLDAPFQGAMATFAVAA